MIDLFDVAWSETELEHVEGFLADADSEGVTWEAKADDERSALRPESIRKAVCGFANQIGGYLILGARKLDDGGWELPGLRFTADEPDVWIGQVLRGLRPTPRFDVKTWARSEGRVAAVILVEPVAESPCMTPQGRVYERVTGETLPVDDPALLDRLFRRGADARARIAALAPRATERALEASGWTFQKSVGLSVALAPLGRETEDISSRLFTQETRQAMVEATWSLMLGLRPGGQPDGGVYSIQRQDSHAALIDFAEHRHCDAHEELIATSRSTWLTQASWDGTVAASLTLSDADVASGPQPEDIIAALWRVIVPLGRRLGGYGPCQLSVLIAVTKTPREVVQGTVVHAGGRLPPDDSLYADIPATTQIGRIVDLDEPEEDVLGSIGRETRRAAGEVQDES